MSTAVAVPSTGASAQELRRTSSREIGVYNPTDYTITYEMYGDPYRFPPQSFTPIKDKMRWQTTLDINRMAAEVKTLWDRPRIIECDAYQIVSAICENEQLGVKGVCPQLGDGHDEERQLEGRRKWIAWRLVDAQARERAYVGYISMLPAGVGLPRMKPDVKEALSWLKRYEAGEFEFEVDDAAAQAEAELLFDRHPELRKAAKVPAAPAETTDLEGAPGPKILARAKELKLKLSSRELEGLIEEDREVISAVLLKLANFGTVPRGRR